MLSSAAADRVASLFPVLQRKSYQIDSNVDPDDLAQDMALRMMERALAEPSRLDQKDAYLVNDAFLNGGCHSARRVRTYSKYVDPHVLVTDECRDEIDDDLFGDNPNFSITEIIPVSEEDDPETAAERSDTIDAILDVVRGLSESNRAVVRMLVLGYSEAEIAAELGVSRPAISQRKDTIAKVLARAL